MKSDIRLITLYLLIAIIAVFLFPVTLPATSHDTYVGDTAIYGTTTTTIQPNVLVIIDTSLSMDDEVPLGDSYDPETLDDPNNVGKVPYPIVNACEGDSQPCETRAVYRWVAFGLEGMWVKFIDDIDTVTCVTFWGNNVRDILVTTGQYQGRLRQDGSCGGWLTQPRSFALGNYINWLEQSGGMQKKIDVAKDVVTNLIDSTLGVKFGAMRFNTQQGGDFFTDNAYTTYIKDMETIFSGTTTNREALITAIDNLSLNLYTPLAETLFEAMRYYSGGQSVFNGSGTYTSPIEYACQKNYVILISDGMSTRDQDSVLTTICNSGDCDGDAPEESYSLNGSDYLDDVAHYLYNNDMSSLSGDQNVITYTIGFGLSGGDQDAIDLLQNTAQNGAGAYYNAANTQGLSEALREIISIILQDNTSFVAPVVPVSPENRTFSGSRVYLGFFRPLANAFWYGNLKKYGIDSSGNVTDKDGNYATYVDSNGDGVDDLDSTTLPSGAVDGSFREISTSYWSTIVDGGEVDIGGAGGVLLDSSWDFSTDPRNIYTYTGTNTTLTNSSNAFTTSNTAITYSDLGVPDDTEKDKLINFIHGKDAYDEDSDTNTSEKRGWVLTDILHSKPLVINYASYTFNTTNEASCSTNNTIIYVGTNGGMLHAFRDCDGKEIWSFIPQDLLSNLQYLTGSTHTYYVDSSPSVYIYDADKDGNIETIDGDKVIIIFGERRGGGFYYALDVSDFNTPKYLWRFDSSNTDFSELGQTWSEPELGKVKIGTQDKIVAFIGAGYDNVNEDSRIGATQTPVDTTGRGIYVVEIATLDSSGIPTIPTSATKVWGYTNADDSNLTFSILSAVTVVDTDFSGYIDRLYVGDAGGNLWAFDVGDTDTSNWTGRLIFSSNPGSGGSTGRKIFYRPSITLEMGYQMLFFGTGDRAHPTDTDVVDRLYAIKDKGQTTINAIDETNLLDVTTNELQGSATTSSEIQSILTSLQSGYGWYIKLNQNSGEKVLAPAIVFSKKAYYTTYTPNTGGGSDPCDTGNRGTARVYVVNYKTGEAVYNFNTANDDTSSITNTRAVSEGIVLQRSDRVRTIGTGIPSGVVIVITPSGISALIGSGGALVSPEVSSSGATIPLYWREVI